MAEEIDFENRHFWNFKSHMTLTLTSDDLESHIVVNVSSTLTNTTIWFVAALSLIVDVRTYGRMDIFAGFIRSSLRRWPKNVNKINDLKAVTCNVNFMQKICTDNVQVLQLFIQRSIQHLLPSVTPFRGNNNNNNNTSSSSSNKQKPSRGGRRYVACDLELWPIKNSFLCISSQGQDLYSHQKLNM